MKVFLQYRERTNIIRTVRTTGDFRKAEISVKTVECKTARCEIERFGNCKYKKKIIIITIIRESCFICIKDAL